MGEVKMSIGQGILLGSPGAVLDELNKGYYAEDTSQWVDPATKAKVDELIRIINSYILDPTKYIADLRKALTDAGVDVTGETQITVNPDGSISVNGTVYTLPEYDDRGLPIEDDSDDATTTNWVLPPPETHGLVTPPDGYVEVTQYWSTAELMMFQFELAMKQRWSSIGNKLILDGLGIAKTFGESVGWLMDFASGAADPFGWYLNKSGASMGMAGGGGLTYANAAVISGACFPVGNWINTKYDPGKIANHWGLPRSGGRTHKGHDLMGDPGLPILAFWSGTVTRVTVEGDGRNKLGGSSVTIRSSADPSYTVYNCHMKSIEGNIKAGSNVSAGQLIGTMGNTGDPAHHTHEHLHIGFRKNGEAIPAEPEFLRPIYNATKQQLAGQTPTPVSIAGAYNTRTAAQQA